MFKKFQDIVDTSAKATVIVRATNDPNKEKKYSTGFVVGHLAVGGSSVVFTVGHIVAVDSDRRFEVIFYGYPDRAFPGIIRLHLPKAEVLILTVEKPKYIDTGQLIFESNDKWNLRFLQLLTSVSHPCNRSWCAGLSIVNRPLFSNADITTRIEDYDRNMFLFDHSLQFGGGSSGAALMNEDGNVVGIQTGEVTSSCMALSGDPLYDALTYKSNKVYDLLHELIVVCLSDLQLGYRHLQMINYVLCGVKQAVHVRFIDSALREHIGQFMSNQGNLNDLIVRYVRIVSYSGASASGASGRGLQTLGESSHPYSPSPPPYSTHPSSGVYPPQATKSCDDLSHGATKSNETALASEHVGWVNGAINEHGEICMEDVLEQLGKALKRSGLENDYIEDQREMALAGIYKEFFEGVQTRGDLSAKELQSRTGVSDNSSWGAAKIDDNALASEHVGGWKHDGRKSGVPAISAETVAGIRAEFEEKFELLKQETEARIQAEREACMIEMELKIEAFKQEVLSQLQSKSG